MHFLHFFWTKSAKEGQHPLLSFILEGVVERECHGTGMSRMVASSERACETERTGRVKLTAAPPLPTKYHYVSTSLGPRLEILLKAAHKYAAHKR